MVDKKPNAKKRQLPKKVRDELRIENIRKTFSNEKPKVTLPKFSWDKEKAKIRWLGPYKPTDRHADDITVSELTRLRLQNAKLRDALIKVYKAQYLCDAKDIAAEALEQ